jgi:hypothetical protein
MFRNWPDSTKVMAEATTSNNIQLFSKHEKEETPTDIKNFLAGLGWQATMKHPDNEDDLWSKPGDMEIASFYFRWYEAVAYEWYRMLTIGGL